MTMILDVEFSIDTISKTKMMLAQKYDTSPDEVFFVLSGRLE